MIVLLAFVAVAFAGWNFNDPKDVAEYNRLVATRQRSVAQRSSFFDGKAVYNKDSFYKSPIRPSFKDSKETIRRSRRSASFGGKDATIRRSRRSASFAGKDAPRRRRSSSFAPVSRTTARRRYWADKK